MNNLDTWAGVALPLVVAGLLLAAIVRAPGSRHGRVTREGGTVFLPERLMHAGYAWVHGLAGGAHRLGVTADVVSWVSLALGLVAGGLVAAGWLGCAAWALALSGLGDGVDGALARQQGQSSSAGAILDSVLDRYVEFFFFAGLLMHFAGQPWSQLAVVTALFGGFMVTYSTAKAEALHLTPPRGWMKRPERIVWLIAGSAFAAGARAQGLPPDRLLLGVVLVIAVFANLSALRRLRALSLAAGRD